MNCVICKNGETINSTSTFTLEKNNSIVVFKNVPAKVCQNCGHAFFDEKTSNELLQAARDTIEKGVEVEVRTLKNAS